MKSSLTRALAFVAAAFVIAPALFTPTTASADVQLDDEEIAALNALNEARIDADLEPFTVSPILTEIAEYMADDNSGRDLLDHTDRAGRGLRDRNNAFGYSSQSFIRENLAAGRERGVDTMQQWMDSPGHFANNMATDVVTVGIARVPAEAGSLYGWFWALEFGSVEDAGTVDLEDLIGGSNGPNPDPPIGTEAGTFTSDFPEQGVGLNIWNGGSIEALSAGVEQGAGQSVFVAVDGTLIGYIPGAPSFVNAAFVEAFPDGDVPAGTPVLVVV